MMEESFYRDVNSYLEELFRFNPIWATQFGDHRFDSLMPDYSRERISDFLERTKRWRSKYQSLSFADPQVEVDREMMLALTTRIILDLEAAEVLTRDPSNYVDDAIYGPYLLLLYDFAPLEERLYSVRERLKLIPSLFQKGEENLKNPPRIWVKIAVETLKAGRNLLGSVIPSLASSYPSLKSEVEELSEQALLSSQEFISYLESLLPSGRDDFALGKDLWDEYARRVHLLDYGSEEILEYGRELASKTEEEMRLLACTIDPEKEMLKVLSRTGEDHPQAQELIPAYRNAVEEAKRFIQEKDIASIPEWETLEVMETPEFDRILTPYAAYLPPGPLSEKQQGIFWVTPVDPELPLDEQNKKLSSHSFSKISLIAVHEAYPGHHLQIIWSNASRSLPRKIGHFFSTLFVEGWAFYCEEMMEKQGFFEKPVVRLHRLADQLFRAYRIIIDVGLHAEGMSIEEGTRILTERVGLEESGALSEVWRYTQTPTQPMSYMIGKREISNLREVYWRKTNDLSLKGFHDTILRNGSLPPSLQRKLIEG